LKEKFENKKLNTSDSKHNIPTYIDKRSYFVIVYYTLSNFVS
jgi:hypothetical protein